MIVPFDIIQAVSNWDDYDAPTVGKLKRLIRKKIDLIHKIENKGIEMTERQHNFVKVETEFIDCLLYYMELNELKVKKIVEVVKDYEKSNGASILDGAKMRQQLRDQSIIIERLTQHLTNE